MREWITDRRPTEADANPDGRVWGTRQDGKAFLYNWASVAGFLYPSAAASSEPRVTAWKHCEPTPAPYVKPSVWMKRGQVLPKSYSSATWVIFVAGDGSLRVTHIGDLHAKDWTCWTDQPVTLDDLKEVMT